MSESTYYNMIMEQSDSTVVAEYTVPYNARPTTAFQSEDALEKEFIEILKRQGYEYLPIHEEADLVSNLRVQLEKLNDFSFSDDEDCVKAHRQSAPDLHPEPPVR